MTHDRDLALDDLQEAPCVSCQDLGTIVDAESGEARPCRCRSGSPPRRSGSRGVQAGPSGRSPVLGKAAAWIGLATDVQMQDTEMREADRRKLTATRVRYVVQSIRERVMPATEWRESPLEVALNELAELVSEYLTARTDLDDASRRSITGARIPELAPAIERTAHAEVALRVAVGFHGPILGAPTGASGREGEHQRADGCSGDAQVGDRGADQASRPPGDRDQTPTPRAGIAERIWRRIRPLGTAPARGPAR